MNNNDIYGQGCWIIKARVGVIVLEAIARIPKYQPLGFQLQLLQAGVAGGQCGREWWVDHGGGWTMVDEREGWAFSSAGFQILENPPKARFVP